MGALMICFLMGEVIWQELFDLAWRPYLHTRALRATVTDNQFNLPS